MVAGRTAEKGRTSTPLWGGLEGSGRDGGGGGGGQAGTEAESDADGTVIGVEGGTRERERPLAVGQDRGPVFGSDIWTFDPSAGKD